MTDAASHSTEAAPDSPTACEMVRQGATTRTAARRDRQRFDYHPAGHASRYANYSFSIALR